MYRLARAQFVIKKYFRLRITWSTTCILWKTIEYIKYYINVLMVCNNKGWRYRDISVKYCVSVTFDTIHAEKISKTWYFHKISYFSMIYRFFDWCADISMSCNPFLFLFFFFQKSYNGLSLQPTFSHQPAQPSLTRFALLWISQYSYA